MSIADVYDALTSERCYKKAFDHDTAIQMILDGQCGQFNPILLKCLKELSIRNKYRINIIASKENGQAKIMPGADYVIRENDHLMVMGRNEDVDKIVSRIQE